MRCLRRSGGAVHSLGCELGAHTLERASDHQRLRLRQRVGDERVLLLTQWMRGAKGNDEFDGGRLRALVQPLEKSVLAVAAGSAPQRGCAAAIQE